MLQNVKKKHKIHKVTMSQKEKLHLGTTCHSLWWKNGTLHLNTNCNPGMKCHWRDWPYYREIKCHILTFHPKLWVLIFAFGVDVHSVHFSPIDRYEMSTVD
jgi:hypothetical protein